MAYIRCSGNIGGSLKVRTASGNPCTFETNLADKLVSLKAAILASGGGGTPATPNPIVGHSELNLVRCGKNFIRDEFVSGLPSTNIGDDYDSIITSTRYAYLNLPNISGNVTVSITDYDANYIDWVILFGYVNGKLSGKHAINNFSGSTVNLSGYDHLRIIIGAVVGYIVPSAISTVGKVQLELGSTATPYAPYNGTPYLVQFGQTVYGGELDVTSGVLTITHGYVDLGSLTWIAAITNVTGKVRMRAALTHKAVPNSVVFNANCDIYKAITASETYTCVDGISGENTGSYIFVYDSNYSTTADLSAFTSMVNGHYLAYELATPIVIDVSELSVDTIVGVNNVFHDGNGDTEVKYLYKA